MMYKIRYNLVDIPWNLDMSQLASSTRGHSSRFFVPRTHSSAYASSFFPRTIQEWNRLPVDPAAYQSLNCFKTALRDARLK